MKFFQLLKYANKLSVNTHILAAGFAEPYSLEALMSDTKAGRLANETTLKCIEVFLRWRIAKSNG